MDGGLDLTDGMDGLMDFTPSEISLEEYMRKTFPVATGKISALLEELFRENSQNENEKNYYTWIIA